MFNTYEYQMNLRDKRSIVLTIATRTGIKDADCWIKFNNWMLNCSVLKKELHKYNSDELDKLIKQFRGLEANYCKSATKTGTKAWMHKNKFQPLSQN
ncbi:hypothetical protein [Empedobacter brevis]|uniref:hypothetical protein n=1 Tax=Empedobacter brevis TaxID=247 RepID=UPI0039B0A967